MPKKAKETKKRDLPKRDRSPDRDMSGSGWVKSLTWKYLSITEDRKVLCEEYDFYADSEDLICECGTNRYLWLVPDKTVLVACTYCNTAMPIGRHLGIKRREYYIAPEEAIEILLKRPFRERDLPLRPYYKLMKKAPRRAVKRKRPSRVA